MYELPKGTILIGQNRYVVERVLGQGGFGFTYLVTAQIMTQNIPVTTQFAVKEFFLKSHCMRDENGQMTYAQVARDEVMRCQQDFKNEAQRLVNICLTNRKSGRLAQMNNHHIVPVNECFDANGTSYFVMEYLGGGSLRQRVKQNGPMSEVQALSFIKPIVDAVEFLHKRQILHMDIKPENIVMRSGGVSNADVPMLIDFGISLHFDDKGARTTLSNSNGMTPGYSPMEQAQPIANFDPRVDVYALAATTFYLLTGQDPVNAADISPELIKQSLPNTVSKRTTDAIVHAMQPLRQYRTATATDFLKELAASYTLPVGYILSGPLGKYRITRILDDCGTYIKYEARPASKDASEQQENAQLIVMEQFVKGISIRNHDLSVTLGNITQQHDQEFADEVRSVTGLNPLLPEPDMAQGKNGIVEAICYRNGGTRYSVSYASFKPQSALAKSISGMAEEATNVAGKMTDKLRKNAKFIAAIVLAGLLIGGIIVYAPKIMKSFSKPHDTQEMVDGTSQAPDATDDSTEAGNNESLKPETESEATPEAAKSEEKSTQTDQRAKQTDSKDEAKKENAQKEKTPPATEKDKAAETKKTQDKPTPDQSAKTEPKEKPAASQAQADQQAMALIGKMKASGQPSAADMKRLNALRSKASPKVQAQIDAFNKSWDY